MYRIIRVCLLGLENVPVLLPGFDAFRVGGEEVQQSLLASALSRMGYVVSVVSMDYGQGDRSVHNGVTVFKAYRRDGGLPVLRFLHPRLTSLWSALRRADSNVYYTSCAGFHVGVLALFCRIHGRKFIYRVAHDYDCDPSRLLIHLARDKFLYEYGLRQAHTILAQSERQRALLLENYGLSSQLAAMLVEKPHRRLARHERDIDLLWVNNIRRIKRPDRVLDLAECLPDLKVHMVGGAHEPELYNQVKARAFRLPNVVFHGAVPYREVGRLYDRSHLLINCSEAEGFPNSYLQSWIRGIPVVAFFDPDGLIRHEGLGVQVGTLEEMVCSVRHLLSSESALEECSARCVDFMRRRYSDEDVVSPYTSAIENAMQ